MSRNNGKRLNVCVVHDQCIYLGLIISAQNIEHGVMRAGRCQPAVSTCRKYELAKTSWTSSKDTDTADWRRNSNQLETDVA